MKAIVLRGAKLLECDVPEVVPASGQVLVRTLACGICGSDLHAVHNLEMIAEMGARAGANSTIDPQRDLVMGHEFCGEILDYGADTTRRLKSGTRVVSMPFAIGPGGPELIGFSNRFSGGFGERIVLTEAMLLEVPNGLSAEHAAMVEPMAVALHAVGVADLSNGPVALVIGCGPVGLAVIAALKAKGAGPVVASDYAPERRRLAEVMGADIVVDPATTSPHTHWSGFDVPATLAELGMAQITGQRVRGAVIFECVGIAGVLQSLIESGPPCTQIVVVGACMTEDRIVPVLANNKQLRMDFVFAYSAEEFSTTLQDIAEGRIDVTSMVTSKIGRSEVVAMFDTLSHKSNEVKVIVEPNRL